MKEVERVSLGGYAFTLDEDAAALAHEYLEELERHYAAREGGSEILEGIEERMAELLHEKCGRDGVASKAVIQGIIDILGRPEQIDAEDDAQQNQSGTARESGPKKKLYRDLSDKVVAGVCSGLAAYFKLDVALFRIAFTALTLVTLLGFHFGRGETPSLTVQLTVPVLYVILWISMPAAKTVRQRWEQRGEDGTIHGIQQSVENGAREVGEAIQSVGNSGFWNEFARIFEKIVGLILLIVGFGGLFAGGVGIFGTGALRHQGWISGEQGFLGLNRLYGDGMAELYRVAPMIADAISQPWVQILLILVIFLPFLGILYGGLQLLFGFKSPKWHPGLVIFILWLLSIIASGILIATGALSTDWLTI
ncbi:MAG: PspC domain-containing protein [Bacteroidales bacterium]|nr:PspC domain-containing protein [Bacteroidales bacterium]